MSKLNENVKALFNSTKIVVLATADSTATNAVPILFKKFVGDDTIVLFQVFMNNTITNIQQNPSVAITFYNGETLEGYQIKGTATYTTDAKLIEEGNAVTSKFGLATRGAVKIKVEEIIVQTPCPDNGKKL